MAKKILGPIFGLLLGVFLAIDLIVFGVIAFESVLVLVLPILGVVLGGVLAFTTPLGTKTQATVPSVAQESAAQDDSAVITSDGA